MENPAPNLTVVLRVNIGCCKACSRKLKKVLLAINGVNSVAVDGDEKLVFITGKVDPKILIKAVEKMGKKAEIVTNKESKKPNNKQTTTDKCPRTGTNGECRCNETRKKEDNSGHKVEDYVAPTKEFDEEICRDPYCRIHKRNRIIHDNVPPGDYRLPMFWQHRPPYPRWSREQPYPYEYSYPSMPRPTTYGVHPGRPMMPGSDNFSNYFSDENARACTIM